MTLVFWHRNKKKDTVFVVDGFFMLTFFHPHIKTSFTFEGEALEDAFKTIMVLGT
jgi:hypothetical protein